MCKQTPNIRPMPRIQSMGLSESGIAFQSGYGVEPCLATEYSLGEQTHQNQKAKKTISAQLMTFGRPYSKSTYENVLLTFSTW